MGLDTVELVMRAEEVFAINLPVDECERVQTVGDLYRLVCSHLQLTPIESPTLEAGRNRLPRGVLNLETPRWTSEDVWSTLVDLFVDQLAVREDEVTPTASILDDLGCD
jgi:acyl carrier protein